MKSFIVLAAFSLSLAACSPATDHLDKFQISAASVIDDPNLTSSQKAEALSLQAETLLSAYGIQESYDTADLALKQDNTNFRAGFFKALLAPLLLQKGIFSRGHRLASKDAKTLNEYAGRITLEKNKMAESALKDFLFQQAPEFKSEVEVQNHLDTLADSLVQLIEFIKAHKYAELSLKANPMTSPDLTKNYATACKITTTAASEYQLVCPPKEALSIIKLNRADFDAIKNMASASLIYLVAWNSYDLSGMISGLTEKAKLADESFDPATFVDGLFKNSAFGIFRAKGQYGNLKSISLDLASGIQNVIYEQRLLCPQGTDSPLNRAGYLFNFGLCIKNSNYLSINQTLYILAGYQNSIQVKKNYIFRSVRIEPANILSHPILDRRQLGPLKFDKCHQLESVGDGNFGGLFSNNDGNLALQMQNADCSK